MLALADISDRYTNEEVSAEASRASERPGCDRFRPHRYLSGAGKQIGFASQGS
jgi:hypothetical protein